MQGANLDMFQVSDLNCLRLRRLLANSFICHCFSQPYRDCRIVSMTIFPMPNEYFFNLPLTWNCLLLYRCTRKVSHDQIISKTSSVVLQPVNENRSFCQIKVQNNHCNIVTWNRRYGSNKCR